MNYIATMQDSLSDMGKSAAEMAPSLVIALIVIIVTWLLAKTAVGLADRIVGKTHMRASLQQLAETLIKLLIWLIGLLVAAAIVFPGFSAGGMIAGLGIGAVAIGFAFQDIFENFLAGVLIMLREKMRIGDIIECEGVRGRVEQITLRETYIRHLSNELTVMPNSMLFKNPVEILTDAEERRDELMIGVAYDTDLDAAEAAVRKAFEGDLEGVLQGQGRGRFRARIWRQLDRLAGPMVERIEQAARYARHKDCRGESDQARI